MSLMIINSEGVDKIWSRCGSILIQMLGHGVGIFRKEMVPKQTTDWQKMQFVKKKINN